MDEEYRYFECVKCGAIIKIKRPDVNKYVRPSWNQPTECFEDQGGCGRATKFLEIKKEWSESRKKSMKAYCKICKTVIYPTSNSEFGVMAMSHILRCHFSDPRYSKLLTKIIEQTKSDFILERGEK